MSVAWIDYKKAFDSVVTQPAPGMCTSLHLCAGELFRLLPFLFLLCCVDFAMPEKRLLAGCEAISMFIVARVVHWHLCATFHIPLGATSWHNHHPLLVVENEEVKMLWGFGMITDHSVCNNQPASS